VYDISVSKSCRLLDLDGLNSGSKLGSLSRKYVNVTSILRARTNKLKTDALLHTYAQYASMSNVPAKPSEDELRTESQLNDIFDRVRPLLRSFTITF